MATNYFTFSSILPVADLDQRESVEVTIRTRVLLRLMQLREDSRLSSQDQCSIASLIGGLMVHYGIAGRTELDAHLHDPETHDSIAASNAGERLSD